jgi:sulfite reductase (ferredoxin)
MSSEAKPSPVEGIKERSHYLRGNLAEEMASDADHLGEEAKNLLKFHGSYQQEDRDARKNRAKPGVGKAYMFMIRLKLPAGKLTADQYLAMDEICERHANATLRLTTRQSIQFHGILKGNLKQSIADINSVLVSTLGACGDINRNVMSCPAPTGDPVRVQMQRLCDEVAEHLAPKAGKRAYHEIWLNGEKVEEPSDPAVAEPIYGQHYLPRKFKVGFGLPEDNCTDLLAQCLGFLAVAEKGQPLGYDLLAGGGQGQTNSKPDTYPLLAQPVGFFEPDEVVAASEAIIKLYRDHGNRSDRKRARLKYVMHDWGAEKFRDVFYRDYWPKPRQAPRAAPISGLDLHHGWQRQADGNWFLGLSVENGRIKDDETMRLRTGLREIVRRVRCTARITAQQDILLCDITTAQRAAVDSALNEFGIPRPDSLGLTQKWSMACPAIPTCPLAISESERALPSIVREIDATLISLGMADEAISVRMTGCPNGCARPYQSEVGIVGRSGDKYTLYVGGDRFGRRLNVELQDGVLREQLVPKLRTIFGEYKTKKAAGEDFGAFCARVGVDTLRTLVQ